MLTYITDIWPSTAADGEAAGKNYDVCLCECTLLLPIFIFNMQQMRAPSWHSNTWPWLHEARRGKNVSRVIPWHHTEQHLGSSFDPHVSATGSDTVTITVLAMMPPRIPENHGQHLNEPWWKCTELGSDIWVSQPVSHSGLHNHLTIPWFSPFHLLGNAIASHSMGCLYWNTANSSK